jgi:peroxiredoxin
MKSSKFILVILCLIGLTSFTAPNCPLTVDGYKIGDLASDFKLKNVDEQFVSLSDFDSAKGFIVIFTCNTCPYSVANEDRIIALDAKFKGQGYPVIAINPNNPDLSPGDSFANMQKRAKNKGFEFPYLFDEKQTVFPKYGAKRTPHVYVLQKSGDDLVVKYIGAIDNSPRTASSASVFYVADVVNALLQGKEPKHGETKAIGCGIKV